MSLRMWINAHPALAGGMMILLLATTCGIFLRGGSGRVPPPKFPTAAYYSDDDGATFFTDKINKPTPFDHNGHQAFLAHVYTADDGQHSWVGYLEKSGEDPTAQVKEPGKRNWVQMMSPAGMKILSVKAPAGTGTGPLKELWP